MCEQFRTPPQVRFPGWIPLGSDPEVIALGEGGKVAMHEWIRTMRLRAAIPLTVDARQVIAGLVYLVAYVALDRVSFSESYAQLGITPWSPSTDLSFVLVLLFGRQLIPLLFVAPLVILGLLGYLIRGGTSAPDVGIANQDQGQAGATIASDDLSHPPDGRKSGPGMCRFERCGSGAVGELR